mgnify:CR=1 FL=1
MNRSEMAKLIEETLLKDINLSEEEYRVKRLESDKQAAKNGYEGKYICNNTGLQCRRYNRESRQQYHYSWIVQLRLELVLNHTLMQLNII